MKRKVYLIGAGVGGDKGLTAAAREVLLRCTFVFEQSGQPQKLRLNCPVVEQPTPEKVRAYLDGHPEIREAAVIFAGNGGCGHAGAVFRRTLADGYVVQAVAGVSTAAYFCACAGLSLAGAVLLPPETETAQVLGTVRENARALFCAEQPGQLQAVCARLSSGGLGTLRVTAGEALGTDGEQILNGTAEELALHKFHGLCAALVENPEPVTAGLRVCIPDEEFFRAGIPMTRSEVRAVSVGKLCLHRDSIVYDIGCGTGSVSVECALQARAGIVYAIDRNRAALALTAQNRCKFGAYNIKPVEGEAPGVLRGLPAPDCVFIGGSTGNLPEILAEVLRRNPCARVVLNAISLETVTQAISCMERFPLEDVDIAQVSVAKSRPAGGHKLMQAQNPVYVMSAQGRSIH